MFTLVVVSEIKFEGDIKGVQSIKQIDPKLFQNETKSRKNLRDFILTGVVALTFLGISQYSPEFFKLMEVI